LAQTPWHYTTWLEALDHWQTLATGLIAIAAALIAVGVPEFFARRRARQQVEAFRLAVAVEIRGLIAVLLRTHQILSELSGKGAHVPARDVEELTSLREPVIFPATADRIGLLGVPLAPLVAAFYGNIGHIQFAGRITGNDLAGTVNPGRSTNSLN
jgi:hypothetical protein